VPGRRELLKRPDSGEGKPKSKPKTFKKSPPQEGWGGENHLNLKQQHL